MMRRVKAYIESYGVHFEHLLEMYSLSYNSRIKCFQTHVDMDIFLVLVCGTHAQSMSLHFSYTLYKILVFHNGEESI
jgi:hypothetical protein